MKLSNILNEGYLAYAIPLQARIALAKQFPPKYPEFIGHHITELFGVGEPDITNPIKVTIKVVGYVEEDGLEALIVEVNGTAQRPNGGTYHITWSLDRSKGKKPVDSNALIAAGHIKPVKPYEFDSELYYFN